MSLDQLKKEALQLAAADRRHLIAFLVSKNEQDEDRKARFAEKID